MVTKRPTIITFYYTNNNMLEKLKMHSGLAVRGLSAKEGIDMEECVITNNEIYWYNEISAKVISEIYRIFYKLSYGIDEALILNKQIPNTEEKASAISVQNNSIVQKAQLEVIDGYIESIILESVLNKWWLKCGLVDLYKSSLMSIQVIKSELNNAMYVLYKTRGDVYVGIDEHLVLTSPVVITNGNVVNNEHERLHDISSVLDHTPVGVMDRDKIVITDPETGNLTFTDEIAGGGF